MTIVNGAWWRGGGCVVKSLQPRSRYQVDGDLLQIEIRVGCGFLGQMLKTHAGLLYRAVQWCH